MSWRRRGRKLLRNVKVKPLIMRSLNPVEKTVWHPVELLLIRETEAYFKTLHLPI
jgi:hypothetical protein